jgi:hypothetical protein
MLLEFDSMWNRAFTFLFSCKIYYVVGIWLNVNKVLTALCLGFSWRCGFGVSSFTLWNFKAHQTSKRHTSHWSLCFHLVFVFWTWILQSCKWVHFYSYCHIFMFTNVTYVISPNVKMIFTCFTHVIASSVNVTLMIELNCETIILNF